MVRLRTFCLTLFVLSFFSYSPVADAALMAGDVAVIGFNGDSPEEFSWVPLVDVSAGEIIYFSDAGYDSGSSSWQGSGTTEFLLQFTTPAAGITAGTVQVVNTNSSIPTNYLLFTNTDFGAKASAPTSISIAGDQIVAFQSTDDPNLATFGDGNFTGLFHVDAKFAEFSFDSGSPLFTTDVAPGLTIGTNAVGVSNELGMDEWDNVRYVGPTSGTREKLLEDLTDDANWQGSNTSFGAGGTNGVGAGGFTVSEGGAPIPEPGTFVIWGLLGIGAAVTARRMRRRAV